MVTPTVPAPGDLRAILINNNADKTNDPVVDLILSAEGAIEMLLSNVEDFSGAVWEAFITAKEWVLADEQVGLGFGDGTKTVFIKFRDAALDESEVHSANIELDTTPPAVGPIPIRINNGALRTTNRVVTLVLDATNATQVEIFNEDEFEEASGTTMSYESTVQWTLSENSGVKEVLVVFIDEIGNRSSSFSDTILLTGQEPIVPIILEPSNGSITTDRFITVRGTADPESIVQIQIDGYGG